MTPRNVSIPWLACFATTLALSLANSRSVAVAPVPESPNPPAVVGLETDASPTPLGIDDPHPRFTWRVTGSGDVRQTSARVLVASRPDFLRSGAADVWDSG